VQSLEVGFRREIVLLFKLNAGQAGHQAPEILAFYRDLRTKFEGIPGVISASASNSPLIGDGAWGWPVVPFGKEKPEKAPSGHGSGMSEKETRVLGAGPGFFRTIGIPLVTGREFDERDRAGAPRVAIVNEAWVKVNMDGRNPVGQHVMSYGMRMKPQEMEIIGLAKNARYDDLTGDFPSVVYMPYEQGLDVPVDEMTFFVRTAGDPLNYANAVREIVRKADVRIPVTNLQTQTAQIDHEMSQQAMFAKLCTLFALLALAIACVGLYGSMSFTVARRTPEIGIRMALGAQRRVVMMMVIRDVVVMAAVGLAISVPAAFSATRLVESLLYGVTPSDPASLGVAVAILVSAALVAGYLPARRAARIDPMIAIRGE
jgi:predicted permease